MVISTWEVEGVETFHPKCCSGLNLLRFEVIGVPIRMQPPLTIFISRPYNWDKDNLEK
jgi:hypothetical protein